MSPIRTAAPAPATTPPTPQPVLVDSPQVGNYVTDDQGIT